MKLALGRSLAVLICLASGSISLAGCAARDPCATIGGRSAMLATLYFGRNMPDGTEVSDTDWRRFLASVVTPAFPDGFTVSDGIGQWMDQTNHQLVTEQSKILAIVVFNDPRRDGKLANIRQRYDALFRQQSVGLTLAPVCASF